MEVRNRYREIQSWQCGCSTGLLAEFRRGCQQVQEFEGEFCRGSERLPAPVIPLDRGAGSP